MCSPIIQFKHVLVDDDNPLHPHCKATGDLDGDGFPDLLAASAQEGGLFWYHYPEWTKYKIDDGTFTTDMAVGDIDGDGHLDVIIPSNAGLIWYRNPTGDGGNPRLLWEAINVSPDGARMHDVQVADLDGDGKLDIVTRHQSGFGKMMGNQIHIWKQVSPRSWSHRTFDCPHGEGLSIADINGSGRQDIIIGGRWYANPGDILDGKWEEHLFMPAEYFEQNWTKGDVVVVTGDLAGNGRVDIALSPAEGSGHLSWFEAPADPTDPDWTEHILEATFDHAHGMGLGDFDGDGRLDLVVANMHQAAPPQEVAIYLNMGSSNPWRKQTVATTGSHNIVLVDIGANGRLDIFGANWNNGSSTHGAIEYWANLGEA